MMHNPFSLSGKKILVTGASSGIGESIAIEASKMGASLVITGRSESRLKNTFDMLSGVNNEAITCDLLSIDSIKNLSDKVSSLDGLVFCAGMVKTMPARNITNTAIEEIFQINIFSSIQLIRMLLGQKKINKGASIVLLSSIASNSAKLGNSLYSATKGALNSYGKVLALELASQGIRVNSIQPGFVKSRILENGVFTQEQINQNAKNYPLGIGKPSDIAYASIYLLSNASEWVTGSILTIDGGVTLKN